MGAGRKTQTVNVETGFGVTGVARGESRARGASPSPSPSPSPPPPPPRALSPNALGGVIFGCTNHTMEECFSGGLFGLPRPHISYVQNIQEGLPLFLFNYTTKLLHGIFEAAGDGDENINPFAWSRTGGGKTFPAQVPVRIAKYYSPVPESVFRRVISQNYYTKRHFQFELDHVQTSELCALFEAGGKDVVPHFFGISRAGKAPVIDRCNEDDGGRTKDTTFSQDEWGNPKIFFQDGGLPNHDKYFQDGECEKPFEFSQDDGWTNPGKSSQDCDSWNFSHDAEWKRPGKYFPAGGWAKPGKSFQDERTSSGKFFQDGGSMKAGKSNQDGGGGWTKAGKTSQDVGWKNPDTSCQDAGWTNPGTSSREDGWIHHPDTSFQDNGWTNPNAVSQEDGSTDSARSFQNNEWKDPSRPYKQSGWKKPNRFSQGSELTNSGKYSYDSGWTNSRNSFQDDGQTQNKGFAQDDDRASSQDDEGKNSEASSQDNGWIKPRKSASSCGRSSPDPVSPSHEGLFRVAIDQEGDSAWQENGKWSWKPENSAQTSEMPLRVCKGQESLQDSNVESGCQVLSDPSSTLGIMQEDQGGSVWGKSSECVREPEVSAQKSETESDVCDEGPEITQNLKVNKWQLSLHPPSTLGNLQEKAIKKDSLLYENDCSSVTNSHVVTSNKSETSELAYDMHAHCTSGDAGNEVRQARLNVTSCENAEPEFSANFASDYSAIESNELSKEDKRIVDDTKEGITTTDNAGDDVATTAEKEKQVEWGSEDDMESKKLESEQLALKEEKDNPLLALQPIDPIVASRVYKNVELCAEVLSETRHLHKEMRHLKQEARSLLQEVCELKQMQSERVVLLKAHLSIVADVQNLKLEFRNLQSQLNTVCHFS